VKEIKVACARRHDVERGERDGKKGVNEFRLNKCMSRYEKSNDDYHKKFAMFAKYFSDAAAVSCDALVFLRCLRNRQRCGGERTRIQALAQASARGASVCAADGTV
jgi:hypothetical protein